jgi:hypothetical protein
MAATDTRNKAQKVQEAQAPLAGAAANMAVPAGDTAASVIFALVADLSHVISGIAWSYSATPTGGNLQVIDGTTTILSLDVTAAGPGFLQFNPPLKNTAGAALTVTLAAGGGVVAGKVAVLGHWTE